MHTLSAEVPQQSASLSTRALTPKLLLLHLLALVLSSLSIEKRRRRQEIGTVSGQPWCLDAVT